MDARLPFAPSKSISIHQRIWHCDAVPSYWFGFKVCHFDSLSPPWCLVFKFTITYVDFSEILYLLRKHCAMHTNNLGLYAVLNAEGLIMLAQHRVAQWNCSLKEALGHLYQDFRSWTQANKISCSHRRWRWHHLHTENYVDGLPTFPFLAAKAYNARVILGWIAVPQLRICFFTSRLIFSGVLWIISNLQGKKGCGFVG